MERRDVEVIKVELPRWLAERFRRYVAEKYGFRRGVLSKAIADLVEKELGIGDYSSDTVDGIVGLGLKSGFIWRGEDLVDALRRVSGVSN